MACQNPCPACPNKQSGAELALAAARAREAEERAAFEQWQQQFGETDFSRTECGSYTNPRMASEWSGWFARAIAALEAGAAA